MVNQKKSPKHTTSFGGKLKIFIKENYKILLFMSSFFVLNLAFLAMAYTQNRAVFHGKLFILLITVAMIINVALCAFLFFAKKRSWAIEKIFLVVGTTLGILYLFAIPIGRVPDEPMHIWRVYSIAQGDIMTKTQGDTMGNFIPDNVAGFTNMYKENSYREVFSRLGEPISEKNTFQRTIGSSPIDYLPQIIGMFIGRFLGAPLIVTFYLARLFGLIFCITIIYFCIKHIPILKTSLFFIACLPLSMQTFIAVSYDSVIFCSAVALLSFVIYCIHKASFKFKPVHFLMIILLCYSLIATKPVYFPICLLLFFIPSRCFKNKKQKSIIMAVALLITLALFLLWASMSVITGPGNGADTKGQISFILSNPIKFAVIIISNVLDMPILYLDRLSILEWLDVHLNEFYVVATLIFFILLCIKERFSTSAIMLSKAFRWAVAILGALTIILIFAALYIQWTPVGAYSVEGVQTRYLLPIAIIVPLLCLPAVSRGSRKELLPSIYVYSFIVFLNFNAIAVLLCSHV